MKQDNWSRSKRNRLEHGVQLPEAVAWRSNAAWLAWAVVQLEFLARMCESVFSSNGLDIWHLENSVRSSSRKIVIRSPERFA
jgi:hypothetical protein